jgi:hypothetical protein
MGKRFQVNSQALLRPLKLPFLLLIQPAVAWLILLDAGTEANDRNVWIGPLEIVLAAVVAAGLLYPIVVSIAADRLRNDVRRMLAIFRPGLYVAAGLGAIVVFLESAVLAAAVLISAGDDGWFIAAAIAFGGLWGLIILLHSGVGMRIDSTRRSYSVLLHLNEHPALEQCLLRLCHTLDVNLPHNILVGREPEFFATPETVTCWNGEIEGGALYLPLPTCRLLSHAEFEARAAVGLVALKGKIGDVQLEFRERVAGAVATAQDVESAKDDWSWFSRAAAHPVLAIFRLGLVVLVRMCIVLGAEWFAFFVRAFQRVDAETNLAGYFQAAHAAAQLCGAQWYVSGLEKEAAISLCAQYKLVEKTGPSHRLGEVLMRIPDPFYVRPTRPSPWLNPFVAWNILRQRTQLFGLSMEWCHQLALDVHPEPCAASLFSDLTALETKITQADQNEFLPEDKRSRERRKDASMLKL